MDSAPALTYNGDGLKFRLGRALREKQYTLFWLGRAPKERQYTLEGQAWHVNAQGSVQWKGVQIFLSDQTEKT